ncbi:transglutaminase family protein [Sphingomonas oryzagri]
MRLRIEHKTSYRYATPVTLQAQRLVLTPRDDAELTTLSRSLRCEPETDIRWMVDVFGNQIATASFSDITDRLTITSEFEVEHKAPEWPVFAIDPDAHGYPFAYTLEDIVDLGALAQPDWLTPGANAVGAWARAFVLGLQTDTLSLLKDMNAGILSTIAYRVRDEEGTQSPAETLQLGSGSCRDIAALFIEGVRHLGMGARAVSGYLVDREQPAEDPGSTHAWAQVYLPGAGWITFDPTHRRVGSGYLVPVGFARLNRQIMPVTGGYLGAPDAFVSMEVTVRSRII